MPIRAIMFDLDGTLIDQFEAIHRSFTTVLVNMGYPPPSYEAVKKAVGGASETTMTKLIGKERAQEAVKLLRPVFEKEMLIGLRALPGSMEILELCRKHKIKTAVLTNNMDPMLGLLVIILALVEGFHLQWELSTLNGKNLIPG